MARARRVFPVSDDTRESILDAAERLFARDGYAGATLRAITRAAGANLAAVQYHFGGKEALYREVFVRRIRPMNLARARALDAVESRLEAGAIPLRTLLEILFRPIADLIETAGSGVHPFVRVMARNLVEPPPFMEKVVLAEFGPAFARFAPHLLRALPHLDRAALLWRARFVIGAANVTFGRMQLVERRLRELGAPTDGETILRQLVAFAEAGLLAPAPAVP
jgi:AcrR family transcriptional regulator